MKKHYFFVLLLFISPLIGLSTSPIYTWVDENGQRHYSNVPHKNATLLSLPNTTTIDDTNLPTKHDQLNQNSPISKQNTIILVSPKNNQSFHFMRHPIVILASGIETYLKSHPNSKIEVLLDNERILTTSVYPIKLETPTAGTYKLSLRLMRNHTLIAKSNAVTIIILPYPRKDKAGTTPATPKRYQNETDGKNYQNFYRDHQNSPIQPQTPYQPTWQDYNKQTNPTNQP
ncbi:DUF4124 domain-containing protein [Thiotrichales bacterium 19S3-7]|nr:DUF4124 domain-containing protein [Thiotrichales bacterium 19S3-7]MCF6800578.1 DUF4124 domain-containing protein [Thiotrichales bacterium 19S3-11]